ncbi:MAG: response regulator [Promethearchaeota archaeon]|nr:MAG: response regulator [Candidatus Lokiarchaeota archaeon]
MKNYNCKESVLRLNLIKPKILVVEDNNDLLFNIELILKSNNYHPLSAKNGKEALKILSQLGDPPDIIISDIMMPQLDGYEFFKEVSSDPRWNSIPFIFLTAKSSPEDIRLGKLLGADDYITKPFDEKDLLAVISGKIARVNRAKLLNSIMEDTPDLKRAEKTSRKKDNLYILIALWDDKYGPKIVDIYPKEKEIEVSLDQLANQLFSASISIYGHEKITKSEDLLLNLRNLKKDAYLLFDSYPDKQERFGEKQYMIAALASRINFFHSLEIKKIFNKISKSIKEKTNYALAPNWDSINQVLQSEVKVIK